jgi:hypothetical protein
MSEGVMVMDSTKHENANNVCPRADYPQPHMISNNDIFIWSENQPAVDNDVPLGKCLAAVGDVFRRPQYAGGLILATAGSAIPILKASTLAAVMAGSFPAQMEAGFCPIARARFSSAM